MKWLLERNLYLLFILIACQFYYFSFWMGFGTWNLNQTIGWGNYYYYIGGYRLEWILTAIFILVYGFYALIGLKTYYWVSLAHFLLFYYNAFCREYAGLENIFYNFNACILFLINVIGPVWTLQKIKRSLEPTDILDDRFTDS